MTMPEPRDQWLDAVAKLTELTQNGQLEWGVDQFFEAPGAMSPAYTTTYKNRPLRLQKRRRTEDRWRPEAFVLEFVDLNGATLWTVPDVDAIEDLFAAVQYQTAGVKDFLKNILADES
jgi:hypothetical protein